MFRSSCSYDVETCNTGQFSQVKLVFRFGFLAVGPPSEFLLTSGVLGKIKGSLYLVFRECRVFYFFLFLS